MRYKITHPLAATPKGREAQKLLREYYRALHMVGSRKRENERKEERQISIWPALSLYLILSPARWALKAALPSPI